MKPKFFLIFIFCLVFGFFFSPLTTHHSLFTSEVYAALSCDSCHGYPPGYASETNKKNSHPGHSGVGCGKCHIEVTTATATTDYIITYATNHVNGTYNVWGVNFTTYNFNVNGSSCTTNSACHGGQAYWGGPKKTCYDCHFGTADTDNYNFDDGFMARISTVTEYWVTGHGRSSTTAYDSKNRGAGIGPWRVTVSTADYCLYCHKKEGTSHGDSANFFRLRYSTNATCLDCHASPTSPGVNPGAGFTNVNASTKVATPHWGVKHGSETAANLWDGGKYCWDCHDPHGDFDLYGSTIGYMIQRLPVQLSSDTVPGVPAVVASTGTRFWSGVTAPSTYSYTDYVTTAPAMFGGRYVGVCNVCHDASVKYFSMNASTPTHQRSGDPRCTSCHPHNENFKGTGQCPDCHNGAQGERRAITGNFTLAASSWNHKRAAGGVVTSTDCAVCHLEGYINGTANTSYHEEFYAQNGVTTNTPVGNFRGLIQLRNPDANPTAMIQFSTWNGRVAGVGGSTWTAGSYRDWAVTRTGYLYKVDLGSFSFVKFSRSTKTATLEPWVTSVQNNLCIKCHDANKSAGGANQSYPTGQASSSPFMGANDYIVDVDTQFATTNASYHPVKGPQNNPFCDVDTCTAPWNALTKSTWATSGWGQLISCWDCHIDTSATPAPRPWTHGGGRTSLRGAYNNYNVTTDVCAAGPTALCVVCHLAGIYGGTEVATDKSAFLCSGGESHISDHFSQTSMRCGSCHSSSWFYPGRRIAAADAHGFNLIYSSAQATTGIPTGSPTLATYVDGGIRPFCFLRNTANKATATPYYWTGWQPRNVGGTAYTPGCYFRGDNTTIACDNGRHVTTYPGWEVYNSAGHGGWYSNATPPP